MNKAELASCDQGGRSQLLRSEAYRMKRGTGSAHGPSPPGRHTYLFLLGCGVQHEGTIRIQGTGDPTEEGPHGHTCVHQCYAGGVQATGQELSATGSG